MEIANEKWVGGKWTNGWKCFSGTRKLPMPARAGRKNSIYCFLSSFSGWGQSKKGSREREQKKCALRVGRFPLCFNGWEEDRSQEWKRMAKLKGFFFCSEWSWLHFKIEIIFNNNCETDEE